MNNQILLTEAAKIVGKAPATLRRLINDGRIASTKDSQGRNRVRREDVIAYYAMMSDQALICDRAGASHTDSMINALRDQITILTQTVDREREENKELRVRIREMEQERTQHLAEMRAILSKDSQSKEGVISRWIRR
jgi:predicted site-specific integrase-resolvase